MMKCYAMGCGFQFSTQVSILFSDWTTDSQATYAVCVVGIFLFAVFCEFLRMVTRIADRKLLVPREQYRAFSPWKKFYAKALRALAHLAHMTFGYLVMLIVMSYNFGIFCGAMLGFALGFMIFSENYRHFVKKFPNDKRLNTALEAEEAEEESPLVVDCH